MDSAISKSGSRAWHQGWLPPSILTPPPVKKSTTSSRYVCIVCVAIQPYMRLCALKPLTFPSNHHQRSQGSGVVRTRDLTTGELFESPIRENSTVIAPPNTVWMVENNGDELLQVLVVMGCHQPGIDFFPPDGLNSSGSAATDILKVMPWNKQCPPTALESLLGSKIVPG